MMVAGIFAGLVCGFLSGVKFSGSIQRELQKLHEKADAILAAVRK